VLILRNRDRLVRDRRYNRIVLSGRAAGEGEDAAGDEDGMPPENAYRHRDDSIVLESRRNCRMSL
jgi:hypothetical protein